MTTLDLSFKDALAARAQQVSQDQQLWGIYAVVVFGVFTLLVSAK